MHGARWEGLQEPQEPEPEKAPGPVVASREVKVEVVDEALRVTAIWQIESWEPGWFDGTLIDGVAHLNSATWNTEEATTTVDNGLVKITGWVDGPVTIELVAEIPGDPEHVPTQLRLLPAVRGLLSVDAPGLEATVVGTGAVVIPTEDGFHSGAEQLTVSLAPPVSAAARGTLAIAHAGVGVTIGDAEIRGRAKLRWEVRRGSLERVSFTAGGTGRDLDVTGPNVRSWSRSGNTITVELQRPADRRLDIDIHWTSALPSGAEASVPMPSIVPKAAWRTDATVQVARDGDVEVVPRLTGWEAIPAATLPDWGEGLVEGTVTAAFQRPGGATGGALNLLRLELIEQPPVVIDVAQYTIATTQHGRTLATARYEVRNERASHLRIVPPEGTDIIGVRVSGETSLPVTDDQPGWLIPLERSVETVEGLLTFPVEVSLLGNTDAWLKKEERGLVLPVLSAPVAVSRATVYLPPGYDNRHESGAANTVDSFSEGEGIAYGFALDDGKSEEADTLYRQAVSAWMDNDFDEAQGYLDDLSSIGASNDNLKGLQSNLDLVEGKNKRGEATGTESVVERRVKEQARARAVEDERRADEYKKQAEELQQKGDYAGSSAYYNAALDIGRDIEKLEQNEAVELSSRNAKLEDALKELEVSLENQISVEANAYEVDLAEIEREVAAAKQEVFHSKATLDLLEELVVEEDEEEDYDDANRVLQRVPGVATGSADKSLDFASGKKSKKKSATKAPASSSYSVSFGSAPAAPEEPDGIINFDGEDSNDDQTVYDFTGMNISGELVAPQGGLIGGFDEVGSADGIGGLGTRGSGAGGGGVGYGRGGIGDSGAKFNVEGGEVAGGGDYGDYFEDLPDSGAEQAPMATPEPTPDDSYAYDPMPMDAPAMRPQVQSRGPSIRVPRVNISIGMAKKDVMSEPMAAQPETLAAPKSHASAMSVVIPATGQAVLYQQLLIPANAGQVLQLHAKESKKRGSS